MQIINKKNIPVYFALISLLAVTQITWAWKFHGESELFLRLIASVYLAFLIAPIYLYVVAKVFRNIKLKEDKFFMNMHYIFGASWVVLFNPEKLQHIVGVSLLLIYALLFIEVIHKGSIKNTHKAIWDVLIVILLGLIYITSPMIAANTIGIKTSSPTTEVIIFLNLLFLSAVYLAVYITRRIHTKSANFLGLLIINSVFLVNIITIGVLFSTGFEFGPTVLAHMGWRSISIAIDEYWPALFLITTIMAVFSYMLVRFIGRHSLQYGNHSALLLMILLVGINIVEYKPTNSTNGIFPTYDLIVKIEDYFTSNYYERRDFINQIKFNDDELATIHHLGLNELDTDGASVLIVSDESANEVTRPAASLSGNRLNLITIYLESYQRNFTQQGGTAFPGLTPYLDNHMQDFSVAENYFGSVTPTINALISSQCGVNVFLPGKIQEDRASTPHPNRTLKQDHSIIQVVGKGIKCLSDILHDEGYYQVFMQGAPISYAGKGDFLKNHMFDETSGLYELYKPGEHETPNRWGLNDYDLYREILNKLDELPKDRPFSLTTLSLNTHFPGYESEQCKIYEKGNTLKNAIYCTDQALGFLLDGLKERGYFDNSIIFVLGDHMQFATIPNQNMMSKEMISSFFGRIYFAVHSPDKKLPKSIETQAYTPDLAPTALDLLGINEGKFTSGKSIFGERKSYQQLVAVNFELNEGKMTPEVPSNSWNECSDKEVLKTVIRSDAKNFTACERKKIYYFEQKQLYRYKYLLEKH